MVILEPDGTVASDETAAHAFSPSDLMADIAAPSEAAQRPLHYTFDVGGLGTVALEIDNGSVSAVAHLPHRFVMHTFGRS